MLKIRKGKVMPSVGLIKGILTVKDGIDKIQVATSQIKARPSKSVSPAKHGMNLVDQTDHSFP